MIKLEEGKYYRTRDGREVGPAHDDGSGTEHPWNVPYQTCVYYYYPNGKSCLGIYSDDIVAEWEEETPMTKTEDNHKTWGEMTPEEKGAILLAKHEGKTIQSMNPYFDDEFTDLIIPEFGSEVLYYRVKPAPVEVTLYGICSHNVWSKMRFGSDTHKITYTMIDGEPDCDSVRMERLEK